MAPPAKTPTSLSPASRNQRPGSEAPGGKGEEGGRGGCYSSPPCPVLEAPRPEMPMLFSDFVRGMEMLCGSGRACRGLSVIHARARAACGVPVPLATLQTAPPAFAEWIGARYSGVGGGSASGPPPIPREVEEGGGPNSPRCSRRPALRGAPWRCREERSSTAHTRSP